jgi:RNA polymerase sigma-70 factor (ECF subfamily)
MEATTALTLLELVTEARRGSRGAFAEIVRRERAPLVMAARALLSDDHEAEDAAQDALVAAWRGLASLRDPSRFRAWLMRILLRGANRRRRSLRRSGRDADLSRLPGRADPGHERLDALARGVEQLPDKYRVPLTLHYLAGLSYRQVAEATGLTETRVKSRLFDARTRLRRRLGHD